MTKLEPWIQTYTGKKFWLTNPAPEDIDIHDISHALSMQCRFAGHTRYFYSVAEHSLLVSSLLPPVLKLAGLLHDAAEAYLGDVTKPLKQTMNGDYADLEERVSLAIFDKFNVSGPVDAPKVKIADQMVLRVEATQALNTRPLDDWHLMWPETTEPIVIKGYQPEVAKRLFLREFHKLMGGRVQRRDIRSGRTRLGRRYLPRKM